MHLTVIDWAIVAAYFLLSAGIGFAFTRRGGESLSEYFISGRAVPWWLAGASMVATTFAADTPLVVTGLVSSHGVAGNWLWWNMLMSGMLTVFFFARLWRRANVMTDVLRTPYLATLEDTLSGNLRAVLGPTARGAAVGVQMPTAEELLADVLRLRVQDDVHSPQLPIDRLGAGFAIAMRAETLARPSIGETFVSMGTSLKKLREATALHSSKVLWIDGAERLLEKSEPRGTPKTGQSWTPENRPV